MERPEQVIDTRGIPSRECLSCGSDTFKAVVKFDEEHEIAWYSLQGYCFGCGAAVTLPTPLDLPENLHG